MERVCCNCEFFYQDKTHDDRGTCAFLRAELPHVHPKTIYEVPVSAMGLCEDFEMSPRAEYAENEPLTLAEQYTRNGVGRTCAVGAR